MKFINKINTFKTNLFLFLLKKIMSQNSKPLNIGVSKALRTQNKGIQCVETLDESPARLLQFIPLIQEGVKRL